MGKKRQEPGGESLSFSHTHTQTRTPIYIYIWRCLKGRGNIKEVKKSDRQQRPVSNFVSSLVESMNCVIC